MSYIYIVIQVVFIILIGLTGPILPDNLFILSGVKAKLPRANPNYVP